MALPAASVPVIDSQDALLPWWAIGLLDLHGDEHNIRSRVEVAQTGGMYRDRHWEGWERVWLDIVRRANLIAERHTVSDVARGEPELARHVALKSPRAFAQYCDLRDDDDGPLLLEWFHVRVILALRRHEVCSVMLPAQHGKSHLVNMVIPPMDWAEQPESTQIRVHQSHREFTVPLTRKLMGFVENHQGIKVLFPHIRKPERGEPCEDIWSIAGFSIGAKQIVEPSFRGLTWQAAKPGLRGDRVICDDWVTEDNCASDAIQSRQWASYHSAVMTMRRVREWRSKYKTVWGTTGIVGTIYDRRDINCRLHGLYTEREAKGDKHCAARRFSVYMHSSGRRTGQVLWPRRRDLEWVKYQEHELGRRAFRMRFLNLPVDDDEVVFPENQVRAALGEDLDFGKPPAGARVLVGYDPAKGTKSRRTGAKFPSMAVLAFVKQLTPGAPPGDPGSYKERIHIVEWARWSVPQPEQVRRLVAVARRLQCPVVVETNALQESYAEWIAEQAPDVRVMDHGTDANKHDHQDGVESFQPLFANAMIRIHANGAPQDQLKALIDEWCDWPQGRYTDLVMACWFALYQHRRQERLNRPLIDSVYRPAYLDQRPGGGRVLVDLSKYR